MRVLVTGAAGFIGSNLCLRLAEHGHTPIGMDNFDPYYKRSNKMANVEAIQSRGTDFHHFDLRDRDGMASFVDVVKPEVIVHLAAKAGVRNSVKYPSQYVENNVVGSQNVMDAALKNDVGRIVMASTSSVYGSTKVIPFREDDAAVSPQQPYAATKRSAELLANTYHHCYGLQTTVLRFFTVYGPRGRPDMMPFKMADSLMNGTEIPVYEGDFQRDWTYIDDICAGVVAAAERPLGFEILNLGRGAPVSLAKFIEMAEELAGRKANLKPTPAPKSEMLVTFADISKARELLDFEPEVDLEVGLKKFWNWFESAHGPS